MVSTLVTPVNVAEAFAYTVNVSLPVPPSKVLVPAPTKLLAVPICIVSLTAEPVKVEPATFDLKVVAVFVAATAVTVLL